MAWIDECPRLQFENGSEIRTIQSEDSVRPNVAVYIIRDRTLLVAMCDTCGHALPTDHFNDSANWHFPHMTECDECGVHFSRALFSWSDKIDVSWR